MEIVELPLDMHSIMEFTYMDNDNSIIELHNYKNQQINLNAEKIPQYLSYIIDNTTMGPFDYSDDKLKVFLNNVVNFRLNYTYTTYVPKFKNDNYECSYYVR